MSLEYVCDNRGCSATVFVLKMTTLSRPLGWVECEGMDFCSWGCTEAYARQAAAGGPYRAGVYDPSYGEMVERAHRPRMEVE